MRWTSAFVLLAACAHSAPTPPVTPGGQPAIARPAERADPETQARELRTLVGSLRADDARRPDALERYADVLSQIAESHMSRAVELDANAHHLLAPPAAPAPAATDAAPAEGEGASATQRDPAALARLNAGARQEVTAADDFAQQALTQYQTLQHDHPNYEHADRALFSSGILQEQLGFGEGARRVYTELLRRFPQSEFGANAYLSFGEHFVDINDLPHAVEAFQQVIQRPQGGATALAHYKLSQVFTRQNQSPQALHEMGEALTSARATGQTTVLREATHDAPMLYGRQQPLPAWAQTTAWATGLYPSDEPGARTAIEHVGDSLSEAQRFGEAEQLWMALINLEPARLCGLRERILEASSRAQPTTLTPADLARLRGANCAQASAGAIPLDR